MNLDDLSKLNEELTFELFNELKEKEVIKLNDKINSINNNNEYKEIIVVYYGNPKAQPRARANTNFSFFYDSGKSFKQEVLEQIMNILPKNFKPIDTEVHIEANFYKQTPKSFNKIDTILAEMKLITNNKKQDNDNYLKAIQDALNGKLYTDDAIITRTSINKYYSCKPRVELVIKYL